MEDHVAALLARGGVPIDGFGKEGALHLSDLARELEGGVSTLQFDEAGLLIRHLSVVEVSLIACLPTGRLVLVEEEQVLDNGCRRARPPQQQPRRVHAKIRHGESPAAAAMRAVVERLDLKGSAAEAALALVGAVAAQGAQHNSGGGTGEAAAHNEPEVVEDISVSYPGLRTQYRLHRLELRLPGTLRSTQGRGSLRGSFVPEACSDVNRDALQSLLLHLGLPVGRSFLTVEGALGAGYGGRVHLWRWVLVDMELEKHFSDGASSVTTEVTGGTNVDIGELEEVSEAEAQVVHEEMTSLEQAHRDVNAVLRTLEAHKAALPERGGHLEIQLSNAQDRLRRVIRRFANVEGLVSVNSNQLFGTKAPDQKQKRLNKSLVRFIQTSFLDATNGIDGVGASPKPELQAPRTRGTQDHSPSREEALQDVSNEVKALRESGGDESWVLDCLSLSDRTGHRALLTVAELIAVPHASELGTSENTMRRFTRELHRKYEENPNAFHNEAHASIVSHSTHWLSTHGRAWSSSSPGLQVATDVAALAHDVGHFGRNNLFCSNRQNALALTYNDRSILENMHASTCFQVMQVHGCNILRDCTLENYKKYREHVVDLILATDMSSHFEFLGKFRLRVGSPEFSPQEVAEDRRLVTRCFLKAADLGHAALPWEMHERWALRLLTEFYDQGDEERTLGLPISPMCERNGNVDEFRESQKGFLQFVILPLFKELSTVTAPEVGETCVTRLEVNAEDWVKTEPSEDLVAIVKNTSPKRRTSTRARKEVTFAMPVPDDKEKKKAGDADKGG